MTRKNGLADSPFFTPPPKEAVPVFPSDSTPLPDEAMVSSQTMPSYSDNAVELIRKTVKECGKEATTHRFTPAERRALTHIIYTLNMQGVRTNENEIVRIATNFIVNEFNRCGKDSLLSLVLKALNQ